MTQPSAVLFVCMPDFAHETRGLGAQAMIERVRDYRRRFTPLIEAAGGDVAELAADGILAGFARLADARAALEGVGASAETWGVARVSAGVAAGPVIRAAAGYGDRLEFKLEGEAVRRAREIARGVALLPVPVAA